MFIYTVLLITALVGVNAKDLTAPTAVKPTTSAAKDYNYTYVIKMVMVITM